MPSTPHHALGGPLPTTTVATVVAVLCVIVLLVGRQTRVGHKRLAVGGGFGYAAVLLACWALVRLFFWRFTSGISDPSAAPALAIVFAAIVAVLVAQWVGTTVLFLIYRIRVAVGWLFVTAWITTYVYLQVGGESGGLFLLLIWALAVGPALLCALGVLAGTELLLRRVLDAVR